VLFAHFNNDTGSGIAVGLALFSGIAGGIYAGGAITGEHGQFVPALGGSVAGGFVGALVGFGAAELLSRADGSLIVIGRPPVAIDHGVIVPLVAGRL
jgi:hypothetical protein